MEAQDGWEEATDPQTSRTYYYNVHTRETSWIPPSRSALFERNPKSPSWEEDACVQQPLLPAAPPAAPIAPFLGPEAPPAVPVAPFLGPAPSHLQSCSMELGMAAQASEPSWSSSWRNQYRPVPSQDEDPAGHADGPASSDEDAINHLSRHFRAARVAQHVAAGFFILGLVLGLLVTAAVTLGGRSDGAPISGGDGKAPQSPVMMSVWKGLSEGISGLAGDAGSTQATAATNAAKVKLDASGPTGGKVQWAGNQLRAGECLPACGGKGGWCEWCDKGKACCQAGDTEDPKECKGGGGVDYHQCTTVFAEVGEQCGGFGWIGAQNCTAGYVCKQVRPDYSECQPSKQDVVAQDYVECTWVRDGQVWQAPCVEGSVCHKIDAHRSLCLPSSLQHPGEDCWWACGGQSGDCIWCGAGNACCRSNAAPGEDPPECTGVVNFLTFKHECVVPVSPVLVKHEGQDCLATGCRGSGDCAWCGDGNACCQSGSADDPPECDSVVSYPVTDKHTCVAPVNIVEVKHQGQDCWPACGSGGYCDWCGKGNVCCKKDNPSDPLECEGTTHYVTDAYHTCVRPSLQD